jgi:hypothetical protein
VEELGANKRARKVELHVLSATTFETGGTRHPSTGMGEFVSSLLSNLHPRDAITFIKHRSVMSRGMMSQLVGKRAAPDGQAADPQADEAQGAAAAAAPAVAARAEAGPSADGSGAADGARAVDPPGSGGRKKRARAT